MVAIRIITRTLFVEFHYNYPQIPFADFIELVSHLQNKGYRIFHISERGYEFGFIHRRLLHGDPS